MSLLFLDSQEREGRLAQKVFDQQFQVDEKLHQEYDERRKKLMLNDIFYNLKCLNTAIKHDADMIFIDYARWIYQLLVNRMPDLPEERVKEHMVTHYRILKEFLKEELPEEEGIKAAYHLENAIKATEEASSVAFSSERFEEGKLADLKNQYLEALLKSDRNRAEKLIKDSINEEVPLEEIYIHVLQETMYQVGKLWHEGKITVDKEHYATAVTQGIMAQMYSIIFATPRKGFNMLACCVGNELHEMGIRMLSDLFELNGWDSIYLGAAVPTDSILNAVEEHKPHLVALSVTMPHHLDTCHEIVKALKGSFHQGNIKIAVGGRAFQLAPELYKNWDLDIFTPDGRELIQWVNEIFK